jgi:hypothetical protein
MRDVAVLVLSVTCGGAFLTAALAMAWTAFASSVGGGDQRRRWWGKVYRDRRVVTTKDRARKWYRRQRRLELACAFTWGQVHKRFGEAADRCEAMGRSWWREAKDVEDDDPDGYVRRRPMLPATTTYKTTRR